MFTDLKEYFSKKAKNFDAIYSEETNFILRYLNKKLRWDIIERMNLAFHILRQDFITSILDIGCGSGRLSVKLAKEGKKVVGIDYSSNMIKLAREFKNKEKVENVEFICADFLRYNFTQKFDATVALGFFDYVKEPQVYLKKISSLTTKIFIATFPRKGTFRSVLRKCRLFFLRCPVYFYTRSDIYKNFEENSFKIKDIFIVGQLYFVSALKR